MWTVHLLQNRTLLFVANRVNDTKKGLRKLRNPLNFGGAKRDRTADLLNAIQALSQLSYGPIRGIPGGGRFPRGRGI